MGNKTSQDYWDDGKNAAERARRALARYDCKEKVGEGTYGVVFASVDKESKKKVAVKKIRLGNEKDGVPATALREIACLQELAWIKLANMKPVDCRQHRDSGERGDAT